VRVHPATVGSVARTFASHHATNASLFARVGIRVTMLANRPAKIARQGTSPREEKTTSARVVTFRAMEQAVVAECRTELATVRASNIPDSMTDHRSAGTVGG